MGVTVTCQFLRHRRSFIVVFPQLNSVLFPVLVPSFMSALSGQAASNCLLSLTFLHCS